jgi:hypothetical protein
MKKSPQAKKVIKKNLPIKGYKKGGMADMKGKCPKCGKSMAQCNC